MNIRSLHGKVEASTFAGTAALKLWPEQEMQLGIRQAPIAVVRYRFNIAAYRLRYRRVPRMRPLDRNTTAPHLGVVVGSCLPSRLPMKTMADVNFMPAPSYGFYDRVEECSYVYVYLSI